MSEATIADTGPLVAYFDRSDHLHDWARRNLETLASPLLTCEAVIAESAFLLKRGGIDPTLILKTIERGALQISYQLERDAKNVAKLMKRYHDLPMSLADACLVRMTEIIDSPQILTADSDFTIYRRFGRRLIPVIMPDSD